MNVFVFVLVIGQPVSELPPPPGTVKPSKEAFLKALIEVQKLTEIKKIESIQTRFEKNKSEAFAKNLPLVVYVSDDPPGVTTIDRALVVKMPLSYDFLGRKCLEIHFPDKHPSKRWEGRYFWWNEVQIQNIIDYGNPQKLKK